MNVATASGAQDPAANDEVGNSSPTFTIDTAVPTITSIVSDATGGGTLIIGNTIVFTLTPGSAEAGASFFSSYNTQDLSSAWSTGDGGVTYTATYTVTSGEPDQGSPLQITGVTITDAAGNTSSTAASVNVNKLIDANRPTFTTVETTNLVGNNEFIDALHITFSEDIKDTSVAFANFDVIGVTGEAFSSTTNSDVADDNDIYITFSDNTFDTGDTPNLDYTSGTLTDIAGNLALTDTGQISTDLAAPIMLSAVRDNDTTITVTLSELADNGSLAAGDYGGFAVNRTGGGANYVVASTAAGGTDDKVVLTVANMATSASAGVTITYTNDASGNVTDDAAALNPLATDGTGVDIASWDISAPTINTITTQDLDGDGDVDAALIVFSEPVEDASLAFAGFTIDGIPATGMNTGTIDDATLTITLTDGAEAIGTSAKDVVYTKATGGLKDIGGTLLEDVASGDKTEIDGADPLATVTRDTDPIYSGDLDQGVTITYTESMNTGTSPVITGSGVNWGLQTGGAWGTSGTYANDQYTATLTHDNTAETNTIATMNVATASGAQDPAANDEVGNSSPTFTIDTAVPTITSIVSDATGGGTLIIGNTIVFTLTPGSAEAGASFFSSYNTQDLSSAWSTGDGGVTYTATYTVTSGEPDQGSPLQITGVTITDAAGNTSSTAASVNVKTMVLPMINVPPP